MYGAVQDWLLCDVKGKNVAYVSTHQQTGVLCVKEEAGQPAGP